MKLRRYSILAFVLLCSLLNTSCNPQLVRRAINALDAVPPLIVALHRANEAELLRDLAEFRAGVVIFRDNPTLSNYQNALKIVDGILARNVFNFNPTLLAVITAARALFAAVAPVSSQTNAATDESVRVNLQEDAVRELERSVKQLKAEVGK